MNQKLTQTSPIQSYEAFWPFYLGEHSQTWTKRFHVFGLTLALSVAAFLAVTGNWIWIPAVLVVGYGPAWVSHFFIEKNRPATWKYPLWSFVSDFRMTFRYLSGRL